MGICSWTCFAGIYWDARTARLAGTLPQRRAVRSESMLRNPCAVPRGNIRGHPRGQRSWDRLLSAELDRHMISSAIVTTGCCEHPHLCLHIGICNSRKCVALQATSLPRC